MARLSRRRMLVGLGLAATGLGCGGANPFLLPYIFSGGESKSPAEFPLAVHTKKTDAKVVVVSAKMGLPPDLAGVDRMLNAELISALDANVKANDEKVQVLKMPRITEYREQNPNWKTLHPYDVGKAIAEGTDYVIDVEIEEMDLFKPRSRGQWLQGRATVSVNAYDLTKPLKEPAYKADMPFEFPKGREIEKESDYQLSSFRMTFIQFMAKEIATKFSATTPQRGRMSDGT